MFPLVFTLLFYFVSAQESSIGCFVPGECVQSFSIAIDFTSDPQQCLEFCQVHFQQIHSILVFKLKLEHEDVVQERVSHQNT